MKKVGKFEVYTLEECLDKHFGEVGTSRRDKFEAEVDAAVNAYFVGEAIKKARLERKLTQEQLGAKIGVKKAQISKLERGCNTSISTMGRVFKALGVPTATLDLGASGKVALW